MSVLDNPLVLGGNVQPHDTDLDALAALSTTGIVIRTGNGTATTRTLSAGSAKVAILNGSGVSGNPTVDLGAVSASDLTNGTTGAGAIVLATSPIIITPTIASLVNAQHNHTNTTGGGQLTDAALSSAVGISKGGTGQTTASAGFNALSPMTTNGDIIYGGTSGAGTRLAAGTSTQILRGGTTPSWGTVALTTMVSGVLPLANGGTGSSSQNFVDLSSAQTGIAGTKQFVNDMTLLNAKLTAGTSTDVLGSALEVIRNNVVVGRIDNNATGFRIQSQNSSILQLRGTNNAGIDILSSSITVSSAITSWTFNQNVTMGGAYNIVLDTTTGTKIGTATGQKIGFWNVTPVVQQVLATGAAHTVDDVITLLQTLGLARQA